MSFRTALHTKLGTISGLTALISTRYYYQQLPPGVTLPALRWFVVDLNRATAHDGSAGNEIRRVQFDIFAEEGDDADAVAEALKAGLGGFKGSDLSGKVMTELDRFLQDDQTWIIQQDYLLHYHP